MATLKDIYNAYNEFKLNYVMNNEQLDNNSTRK